MACGSLRRQTAPTRRKREPRYLLPIPGLTLLPSVPPYVRRLVPDNPWVKCQEEELRQPNADRAHSLSDWSTASYSPRPRWHVSCVLSNWSDEHGNPSREPHRNRCPQNQRVRTGSLRRIRSSKEPSGRSVCGEGVRT